MKQVFYKTQGTCSQFIEVSLDDDNIIQDVKFIGGCNGNLKGVCSLIKGQKAEAVVEKLQGITCGSKPTSCPDQLSRALMQAMSQK
ncbi:MAG: TIGR03905 family TSCPD domain-containing protein [Prevotella sp.]|nr:TIGR03905 family TSCPD domain-containing protein [Prevotella sp.]MBR5063071.1 TIGR03905 family TSCPD domain-containing protein [Prevotella sp.]